MTKTADGTKTSINISLVTAPAMTDNSAFSKLVLRAIRDADIGQVVIILPNGSSASHEGNIAGHQVVINFKTWRSIFNYAFLGEMAFVEEYIDGNIEISDLQSLYHWYLDNEVYLKEKRKNSWLVDIIDRFRHLVRNENSHSGSQKNISFHYDLGNDFYRKWLDRTMTYSAGIFDGDGDLETSQHAKYNRIADQLNLKDGQSVLEIGCGWGGFAEHVLSKANVDYKGITISEEQYQYALKRVASLSDRKDPICFEDYRETRGRFDHVVSIEMFEAVGEKYWNTYFEVLKKRLKKEGTAVLQVITIDHDRFLKYRNRVDFIQKYIFPGGMLPSKEIFNAYAEQAGFEITDQFEFGHDYARTLECWREEFLANWDEIKEQGFDDRFYRLWKYYLEYCIVAFERKAIDVVHFTLKHK